MSERSRAWSTTATSPRPAAGRSAPRASRSTARSSPSHDRPLEAPGQQPGASSGVIAGVRRQATHVTRNSQVRAEDHAGMTVGALAVIVNVLMLAACWRRRAVLGGICTAAGGSCAVLALITGDPRYL